MVDIPDVQTNLVYVILPTIVTDTNASHEYVIIQYTINRGNIGTLFSSLVETDLTHNFVECVYYQFICTGTES